MAKHYKNRLVVFNSRVVTMIAWFTVVVEANCLRQPVSLLFPHSGIRKGGRNRKENYLSGCFIQLASNTNISHATKVTTLLLKQHFVFCASLMH